MRLLRLKACQSSTGPETAVASATGRRAAFGPLVDGLVSGCTIAISDVRRRNAEWRLPTKTRPSDTWYECPLTPEPVVFHNCTKNYPVQFLQLKLQNILSIRESGG